MVSIIYSTTSSEKEAQKIAQVLVEEKLVACVHILPKITSVYRWKGNIEEADETALLVKTTEKNVEKTIQKIKDLHSYEVPEILVFPPVGGLKEYLAYVDDELA
jgi:periplasmic divalent cation tolerance protein